MIRKFVAVLLAVTMIICMLASCASTKEQKNTEVETTEFTTTTEDGTELNVVVTQTSVKREAFTTVEGIPMKCEHFFNDNETWLYFNDQDPMQINVVQNEEKIEVFWLNNGSSTDIEETVVGQYVLTLSLAVPSMIAAAKTIICVAVGVATTASVLIAADLYGNVIGGIRYSSSSYYMYQDIDAEAAYAIRYGRLSPYNTVYTAELSGNTVMIGYEISEWMAVNRLKNGYDVFATTPFAAAYVCAKAATLKNIGKNPTFHRVAEEGYYPHFHPLGRHWYKNYNYAPHCWFPY